VYCLEDSEFDDNQYLFHIDVAKSQVSGSENVHKMYNVQRSQITNKLPKFIVNVNDVGIPMIADTAASCSIVDEVTFKTMLKGHVEVSSESTNLVPYGSSSIKTLGQFYANLECNGVSTKEKLFITSGQNGCLLSCKASQMLQLVTIANQKVVNAVKCDDVKKEFPKLFEGVGLMQDYAVKLHIDESVKPVAQPHRRIPFHLRQKVEQKLQDFFDADIIERVEGPTPWVSPIVVVPKKETEEIRICTDMRQANKAIKRERHLVPTL
jgi:hypothetical protein